MQLGLDNAGKTTILHSIAGKGAAAATVPTIGFNVESVHLEVSGRTLGRRHCWWQQQLLLLPWTGSSSF